MLKDITLDPELEFLFFFYLLMPKVGLATGIERRTLLKKAAYYIRSETAKQITSNLILMPRPAPPGESFQETRPTAIMGLLDELVHFHDDEIKYLTFDEIVICADPGESSIKKQINNEASLNHLPVRVENLYEEGPWEELEIHRVDGSTRTIRINKKIKKSTFRLSVSVPSSDPAFGLYGSLQNLVYAVHPADRPALLGEPARTSSTVSPTSGGGVTSLLSGLLQGGDEPEKRYRSLQEDVLRGLSDHDSSEHENGLKLRTLYRNLAVLGEYLLPDLAYVDGTHVIGGTGDRNGDVLDGGFALSGDDAVSVDTVLAKILNLDPEDLGHLQYLDRMGIGIADDTEINVVMGNTDDLQLNFTSHPVESRRLDWRRVRLPGENGEAVGYIAPEGEQTEEEEELTETEGETETEDDSEKTDTKTSSEKEQAEEKEVQDEQQKQAEAEPSTEEAPAEEVAPDEDLPLRDRVRNRLIRRGKLEGEVTGGSGGEAEAKTEPATQPEPSADQEEDEPSTAAETTEETTTEDQSTEPEPDDTPSPDTTEQAEETSEETATKEEEEDTQTDSEPAGAIDEDLPLRERIRRRLIRRGKLEGDLPDDAEVESEATGESSDDAPTAADDESQPEDQQKQDEPPTEKEEATKGSDEQETTRETSAASEPAEEPEADTAPPESSSRDEDLSVRDRVRNRLIRRGKMEGELVGDLPQKPAEQTTDQQPADEQQSSPAESVDEADEKTESDASEGPEEKVKVTEDPGPALEPAEEAQNPDEVLPKLSSYGPEEKIRRRLALRAGAGNGKARKEKEEQDTSQTEETSAEASDSAESSDEDTASSTPDKMEEEPEDKSETSDSDASSDYVRDSDQDLRERVKTRLKERGKL